LAGIADSHANNLSCVWGRWACWLFKWWEIPFRGRRLMTICEWSNIRFGSFKVPFRRWNPSIMSLVSLMEVFLFSHWSLMIVANFKSPFDCWNIEGLSYPINPNFPPNLMTQLPNTPFKLTNGLSCHNSNLV
jgi:hypothetical protein